MKRTKHLIVLISIFFILVFTGVFFIADAGQRTKPLLQNSPLASPSYRPGEINPIKNPDRLYLMKDDMLCTIFGKISSGTILENWNKPKDSGLASWETDTSHEISLSTYQQCPNKIDYSPIEIAAGRLTQTCDTVIGAYYFKNNDIVCPFVFMVDNPNLNSLIAGSFMGDFYPETSFKGYHCIDIATGDMDRKVDSNGNYSNEIVVLYTAWNPEEDRCDLVAQVMDSKLRAIDYLRFNDLNSTEWSHPYFSVTMGDFDNDGKSEFAIGYKTTRSSMHYQNFRVSTFKLSESGALTQKDTCWFSPSAYFNFLYNAVDLSSGDYNGDGIEDIAVCISSFTEDNDDDDDIVMDGNPCPFLLIFATDSDLKLSRKSEWRAVDYSDIYTGSNRGSSITSGLFHYDPSEGYTTSRRQIALANIFRGNDYKTYGTNILTFYVDDDYIPHVVCSLMENIGGSVTSKYDNTAVPKITVGNFKGLETETVLDQIAFSWSENGVPKFIIYDVSNDMYFHERYRGNFKPGKSESSGQKWLSVPIVAADKDGKGYYLGEPVHLTIPRMLKTNTIIQEPPKHMDYLPDDNGNWQIVKVSRERGFYSTLTDKTGTTFTNTHEDTTNFAIGGSEKVSAKETVSEDFGILDADVTSKQSEKLSYDYNSVTSSINGNYSSTTSQCEYHADRDDYIQLQFKLVDIWRFPVYGLKDKNGLNVFYDVVMPGPIVEKLNGWGCDISDYYQPSHENGNILSYPQISDWNFPEDRGSYIAVDEDGNKHDLSSAMSVFSEQEWSTGSGTIGISWEDNGWTVKERSHTHKLNFNADVQVGFAGEADVITTKEKWYANIDLSFNTGKSWSTKDYSKSTLSNSEGISLNLPSDADSNQAYRFKPILYSTKDGTLKMAHSVDPMGSTQGIWWTRHYHGQPDPALNLPKKFHWTPDPDSPDYFGTWSLSKYRQDRSRMRCLFLTHNEPKSTDTDKLFVASSPTAGDVVYVSTKLYNYSLDTGTGDFKVRFSYALYNPDLCDNEPDLTTIGDVDVVSMGPLEQRDVYVKWDTSGLGGETPGTGKSYVIYVTVDPDNEVKNEIHELYGEDQSPPPPSPTPTSSPSSSAKQTKTVWAGSNNQGYWPWDNSFKIVSKTDGKAKTSRDISVSSESLEVETTGDSEDYGKTVYTNLPYRLKLKIVSSEVDDIHRDVFFYDNGRMFAAKRSFGLNKGENDFYCRWTPETEGEHTISVKVSEDNDDTQQGNNTVSLKVDVKKFSFGENTNTENNSNSEKSGFCFIATAAYGSYQEPHVKVLRQFRDKYLLTNASGRAFVKQYYKLSPPLAKRIEGSKNGKRVARIALIPVYVFAYLLVSLGVWKMSIIAVIIAASTFILIRRHNNGLKNGAECK